MRDQCNSLQVLPLFIPGAATTDNTPYVSAIISVSGYESVTLAMVTGNEAAAAATFGVLVEDGNDPALADHAAVDPTLLIGSTVQAGFTGANDGVTRKIGYVGYKNFIRVTITPTGNNAAAYLAGIAILGRPHTAPTPNPPM